MMQCILITMLGLTPSVLAMENFDFPEFEPNQELIYFHGCVAINFESVNNFLCR